MYIFLKNLERIYQAVSRVFFHLLKIFFDKNSEKIQIKIKRLLCTLAVRRPR